jgi:hypothetical protein
MVTPDKTEMWAAIALFVLSEVVGMSKLRENSLVQLAFTLLRNLFPAQLKIKKPKAPR